MFIDVYRCLSMFIDVYRCLYVNLSPMSKTVGRWSFVVIPPGRVSAGHRAEAALTAAGGSSLSPDISRLSINTG